MSNSSWVSPMGLFKALIKSEYRLIPSAKAILFLSLTPRSRVRHTRPKILHGSVENGSKGVRRTILVCCVCVAEDGSTLDNEGFLG